LPDKNYTHITERAFTSQVIALARWHKWRTAHFRPAMTQRGRWLTAMSGDIGFPDLIMFRARRAILAELKSAKGRVTPEQEKWLEAAKAAQFEAYIWRPKDIEEIERVLT
jgi:hypothetical protein